MKPTLLDTFCGAGGCTKGYQRAGFRVTGVDILPQKHYCGDDFFLGDAIEYIQQHGHEYDVIHASPPCQAWSVETPARYRGDHPKLIDATRHALLDAGKPFVIENVPNARHELRSSLFLCGSMFGLRVWRHRYFEINPECFCLLPPCDHSLVPVLVTGTPRRRGYPRQDPPVTLRRSAMGIDWPMTTRELDQAIPPTYTEFVGRQLLEVIMRNRVVTS